MSTAARLQLPTGAGQGFQGSAGEHRSLSKGILSLARTFRVPCSLLGFEAHPF
jgi:hypothetical protein